MTFRYIDRAARNHSRQRGIGSDTFDRLMDSRERRPARHRASPAIMLGCGCGEQAEIDRRSLIDAFAPSRS